MYRISVMYPAKEGAKFDMDYYRKTHMPLVMDNLKSFGLVKTGVDQGLSGSGGQTAPYVCVGHLYFETLEGYDKGIAEVGPTLRADIPNYTDIAPIRQISEILDE